jgi:hypothetical protein
MKYLPFEDFEIHTTLTSDEVFYKLRAAVDTQRKWWIFTNKPFWGGEVERHYFRMWRVTWWSRNFTPVISGKIQSVDSGSCLRIKMRMPWYSFLFYSFAFGFIWLSFFIGNANLIVQKIETGIWQIESPWDILPLIVMLAFIYLISVGTYKCDVGYVKKYLLWLTEAGEENIKYFDRIFGISERQIIISLLILTLVFSFGWIMYSILW